jgi:hypothetical protein
MILARAIPGDNLKNAAFGSGKYDGARRNHFFQRIGTFLGGFKAPQDIQR